MSSNATPDTVKNALTRALESTQEGEEMAGANVALIYLVTRENNDIKIMAMKACPSAIDEVGYLETFKHLAQQGILSEESVPSDGLDTYLLNLTDKNMLVS